MVSSTELLGNTDQQQKHDFLYWEYPEQGGHVDSDNELFCMPAE